jgi:hypothetical protein
MGDRENAKNWKAAGRIGWPLYMHPAAFMRRFHIYLPPGNDPVRISTARAAKAAAATAEAAVHDPTQSRPERPGSPTPKKGRHLPRREAGGRLRWSRAMLARMLARWGGRLGHTVRRPKSSSPKNTPSQNLLEPRDKYFVHRGLHVQSRVRLIRYQFQTSALLLEEQSSPCFFCNDILFQQNAVE